MKSRFITFIFLPAVAVFIFMFWTRGIILLDPDFGWHLRMGEIIQEAGIPKTDPFSYTMPSYPFVDHEWLINIVIAKLYPAISIEGLAVIFALLATLAMLVNIPFPIKKWSFVPFVLVAGSLLGFVGIRPQIISWFFFSLLILILFSQSLKWRFVLPFLFFVWANLHGGFGVGIVTLLIFTLVRMWEVKKILYGEIIVLILCFSATLISPYGIRLWWEIWMQLSDSSLRFSISEWMPAFFDFNFALWIFVSLSVFAIIRYRKKFQLSQLVLYFILLMAGLSSARHMPFWLLLALPMTINGILFFAEEAKRYKGAVERLNKVYAIFAVGAVFFVIVESAVNLDNVKFLSEASFYPKETVEYLAVNKSCGQTFSVYSWGGYLIWKLPQEKVFIDGRMPSWRWGSAPASESNYAFDEYNKVISGEIPVENAIEKYNIDTFLLPIEKKKDVPAILRGAQVALEKLFGRQNENYGEFIKQLEDSGMEEVYKDNTAVIYRQKNYQAQCVKPIQ